MKIEVGMTAYTEEFPPAFFVNFTADNIRSYGARVVTPTGRSYTLEHYDDRLMSFYSDKNLEDFGDGIYRVEIQDEGGLNHSFEVELDGDDPAAGFTPHADNSVRKKDGGGVFLPATSLPQGFEEVSIRPTDVKSNDYRPIAVLSSGETDGGDYDVSALADLGEVEVSRVFVINRNIGAGGLISASKSLVLSSERTNLS